jgi:hypothetical protein
MDIQIPEENIAHKIFLIRGQKVMIDEDLADLYDVPSKRLNEQVQRNISRFPPDFMFQLTKEEFENLRSQFATSSWGGRRYLPYVFTEHGVAMLSSVLKSKRAVEMNVFIIRAFVKLLEMLATNKDLAQRMDMLEHEQKDQGNLLAKVYSIVKQLIDMPVKSVGKIGFEAEK